MNHRDILSILLLITAHPTRAMANTFQRVVRNGRWFTGGIGSELATNFIGKTTDWRDIVLQQSVASGDVAIVTGATGGIGAEVAKGLAHAGYTVVIAARNPTLGNALVDQIRTKGGSAEYAHLDLMNFRSTAAFRDALPDRDAPLALLVNNAGTMGGSKSSTVRTNLVGPALLTLGLLPNLRRHPNPRVVNVGSSSHLRAGWVEEELLRDEGRDSGLGAYGQSKLGLMQFSSLLRLQSKPWLTVVDAHPGLVWTPMLRSSWGERGASLLERTGLYKWMFKSPSSGATTILAAALDYNATHKDLYYVNGRPGGYRSSESQNLDLAKSMWQTIVEPLANIHLTDGWQDFVGGMASCNALTNST